MRSSSANPEKVTAKSRALAGATMGRSWRGEAEAFTRDGTPQPRSRHVAAGTLR
jgi:hypothetical protein